MTRKRAHYALVCDSGSLPDKHPESMAVHRRWLYALLWRFWQDRGERRKVCPVQDQRFKKTQADGEEIMDGENYPSFPIVPLWGSELKQSTLVGMREGIDAYDLIRSGLGERPHGISVHLLAR